MAFNHEYRGAAPADLQPRRLGPFAFRSIGSALVELERAREWTGGADNLAVFGFDRDGTTWLMYTATDLLHLGEREYYADDLEGVTE